MKVSIITVCYNSAATIESTIQSVIFQDYSNIEYIIVDGESKDNTLDIVRKYEMHIDTIISENDSGIFDAFNKGIQNATGDIIAILNSDDFYMNNKVISKIVRAFESCDCELVFGNIYYVDAQNTNRIIRRWKSSSYSKLKAIFGWMPAHPAFFVRRSVYNKYGGFNTNFKYSGDYDFMMRLLYKYNLSSKYVDEFLVNMRSGGNSNSSLRARLKVEKEDRLAMGMNKMPFPIFISLFKRLRKLNQFRLF